MVHGIGVVMALAAISLTVAAPARAAVVNEDQVFTSDLELAPFVDTGSNGLDTISTFFKDATSEDFRLNYFDASKGKLLAVQLFASGRITNEHFSGGSCQRGFATPCNALINNDSSALFSIDLEPVLPEGLGPPETATSPLNLPGELRRGFQNLSDFSYLGILPIRAEAAKRDTTYSVSRDMKDVGRNRSPDRFVGTGTFRATVLLGTQGTTQVGCEGILPSLTVCQARTKFENKNDMTVRLRYVYDNSILPPPPAPAVIPLPASMPLMALGLGLLLAFRRRG